MMDCQNILAPTDDDLLRLALDDDPLPEQARVHFDGCSICQQRLARYTRFNAFLLSKLFRSHCPDATHITLYSAGQLPADDAIPVAQHIEQCPLCANEVAESRRILHNFDPFAEMPGPAALIRSARRAASTAIQRIVASLVPWQPQLVTRNGSTEPTTQNLWPRQYSAGSYNISLHISRASNGEIMLLGLFSSTDPDQSIEDLENIPVDLYPATAPLPAEPDPAQNDGQLPKGTSPTTTTHIDDLGNIVFKAVPPGTYTMLIRLPILELVIKGLTIESG